MEISKIAKMLYPFIGEEFGKTQNFLIALLDSVSNDDEATIFGFSDDNLLRIYNGTRSLTKKYAISVSGKFNLEKCSSFIYERLLDDSSTILEQQLVNEGIIINKDVSEICANLLIEAITSIASQTKVKKKESKPILGEIDLASLRINSDGTFAVNNKIGTFFEKIPIPISIEPQEMKYVTMLLAAYADADNCDIYEVPEHLPRNRQEDLKNQRINYYEAESIRRGVRDNFMPEEGVEHFDNLKNDMYNGVIDVYEEEYDDGVKKLKAVLKQSLVITLNGSILSFMPGLLRNATKKGICHMLVDDGRLSWVTEDE